MIYIETENGRTYSENNSSLFVKKGLIKEIDKYLKDEHSFEEFKDYIFNLENFIKIKVVRVDGYGEDYNENIKKLLEDREITLDRRKGNKIFENWIFQFIREAIDKIIGAKNSYLSSFHYVNGVLGMNITYNNRKGVLILGIKPIFGNFELY